MRDFRRTHLEIASSLPVAGDDRDAAEPLTRDMDAGGRAMHGAVAERLREGLITVYVSRDIPSPSAPLPQPGEGSQSQMRAIAVGGNV
jgi:hypothetical protein